MAGNSIGEIFKVTTFGESHGECIGVVIDGCPAGLPIDLDFIQNELNRRRPGQSKLTTQRQESDQVRLVSGVYEGKSLGTPICAFIPNQDHRPSDYDHLQTVYRPSHADFTYDAKFGHRDPRGGGRASARETAARVVAGSIAKLLLKHYGVEIQAFVSQVGEIVIQKEITKMDLSQVESNPVRCPDPIIADQMVQLIEGVKKQGDTVGGVVSCIVKNCPVGLGEPVFDRLHADLGKAMLSINAAKGFDYGSGFEGVSLKGSEHNDPFENKDGKMVTKTNFSGGIQGGISNGMDIYFRVAFKPVATLMKNQKTSDKAGNETSLSGKGRHDPCVVPRAVPIVEAMAAITLADHFLRNQVSQVKPVLHRAGEYLGDQDGMITD